MKNKNKIFMLVMIFLLSFLFFSNNGWNDEGEVNSYDYLGPSGDSFYFNVTQINENIRHVLDYTFIRDGMNRVSKIPFRYSPMELEDIFMEDVRSVILGSEVLYITRDYALNEITNAKDGVAMLTFARVVDTEMDPDIYKIPTGMAITSAVEGVFSPVLDCGYANLEARVVELRMGTQNAIYKEGDYCVVMEFVEGEDPIKIATKLTYHVLGVM